MSAVSPRKKKRSDWVCTNASVWNRYKLWNDNFASISNSYSQHISSRKIKQQHISVILAICKLIVYCLSTILVPLSSIFFDYKNHVWKQSSIQILGSYMFQYSDTRGESQSVRKGTIHLSRVIFILLFFSLFRSIGYSKREKPRNSTNVISVTLKKTRFSAQSHTWFHSIEITTLTTIAN